MKSRVDEEGVNPEDDLMNGNQRTSDNNKSRARAFYEKALIDLKKSNFPLAEFYLQAAVKEDPEPREYQDKLEEVRKALDREKKEEAEPAQARSGRLPDPPPSDLLALAQAPAGKKPGKTAGKGQKFFGIPVKNLNPRVVYSTMGILLGMAIAYSVYASLTRQAAHVDIGDINKVYGIEMKSSSQGDGELHGIVVTESWKAMTPEEKEKKIGRLFQDFRTAKKIKLLIFWDERFSEVARASESGVKISQ